MYSCFEVVRRVASDEYLAAGVWKRLRIRLHLALCEHCSRYARQLRALGAAVRQAGEPVPASEVQSAKSRIVQRFREL